MSAPSCHRFIPVSTLVVFTILSLLCSPLATHPQSLASLRIGDNDSKLPLPGSQRKAAAAYKSFTLRAWKLASGNDLSVTTTSDGHIVFLESDWNGQSEDTACDLPGLKFGVTTLADLRRRFGSNGFGFKERDPVIDIEGGIAMLNSFEVGTNVVTFITKIVGEDAVRYRAQGDANSIAKYAVLDAVSIAGAEYARSEWGDRVYDPGYKKIEWK